MEKTLQISKITTSNIDDIIREEKRRLIAEGKNIDEYFFEWGNEAERCFKEFYEANQRCIHGWFCGCGERLKGQEYKQGVRFLGIRHQWDKRKKGYKVLYARKLPISGRNGNKKDISVKETD